MNKIKKIVEKITRMGVRKTKVSIIPNFSNLNRSLIGKDGYIFLVNDANDEIRQHFDYTYNNNFNRNRYIKFLNYKKKFCKNADIDYYFFLTPDKSLLCKDFLPFEIGMIKRNYDLIEDLAPDFAEYLDHTSYFKTDSHINYLGGKELSYHFLNHIDERFRREDFEILINEQLETIHDAKRTGDLLSERNWSYSDTKKEEYTNENVVIIRNKALIDLKENLPEEFKFDGERETEYYKNKNGLTNLRVLIFRDSMSNFLKDPLSVYFKEILLHWDHWTFPEELVEWYKPDIIMEIRAEKFLENMRYEKITKYETESLNNRNKMIFNSNGKVSLIQNVKTPNSRNVGEITAGKKIKQNIIIPEDLNLNNKLYIEILMATYSRENNGKIDVYLKQDNLSEKLCIDMQEINDNEYFNIAFDKSNFKPGLASIILKGVDGVKGNAVTTYLTKDAPWGGAVVNGKQISESLVLKIYSL